MSDLDYYCEDETWYTPDDWKIDPDENVIPGEEVVNRINVLKAGRGKTWHLKFTAELRELEAFRGQAGHDDFIAISEDHWDDYVTEYVDDVCGDISILESFIDWKRLSRHISMDYVEIEYAGKAFLVR
jgi:hypothetical protein